MRLFIRGAWRSFGDNPQNRPDRSGKSNLSESVSNGSERPLQSSFRQPKEGQDRPHDPFAPILTSYLPTLKAFYGLFGDSYPDAEDESSCSIRLDDCRYLVLTREKHGDRDAPLEKHPKVINLPVIPIDKAASLYLQAKSKGFLPVRTLIQDNRLAMHFVDPDGNTVILKTSFLNGTTVNHDEFDIDPEVLVAAVAMRSADPGRAEPQDVAVCATPEPMMVD